MALTDEARAISQGAVDTVERVSPVQLVLSESAAS